MRTGTTALARSVRLSDGRLVTYTSSGARDGFPVVYCHGVIGAPHWSTAQSEELLRRIGARHLAVNRPGFSGSDLHPGRRVLDFAYDLAELMSALGYERFSVVGVSAGAPYALACGYAIPERIRALSVVSPVVPAQGPGGSSGFRYRALRLPFGPGPLRERFSGLCLAGLGLERGTSPAAMLEDYLVCRSPWGFEPTEVRAPVVLWHGACDRLIPLAHGRSLAGAIPLCTAHVNPGAGHFFYNHALERIVSRLVPAPGLPPRLKLAA